MDIEPKFKSLYFQGSQNPFDFDILHGSGYFAVSLNDSTVAEVQHELEDMTMDSEPPEAADEHKGIQGKQQLEEGSQLGPWVAGTWVAGTCIAASLSV